MTYYLEAGVTYVYRIRYWDSSISENISYVFEKVEASYRCDHGDTKRFTMFSTDIHDCGAGLYDAYVCLSCGQATRVDFVNSHLSMNELSKVTPYIYRLVVPFLDIYTTVFVIRTEEGDVLFDTATYPEDIDNCIVPALRELGVTRESLKLVVVSHNHRDHAGGLARFSELYPDTVIAAGSADCAERVPSREVRVVKDGECLIGPLSILLIQGHEPDCIGVIDHRTETLLSGDGLQLYGIYGSGAWGSNIDIIREHIEVCAKIKTLGLNSIIAAHDFHPWGFRADGKEEIDRYTDECVNALYAARDYILANPSVTDDTELAAMYNEQSGLPTVGRHVFKAVREVLCK